MINTRRNTWWGAIEMDQKNLDIYGREPIPWSRALEGLEAATPKSFWRSWRDFIPALG